MAADSFKCKHRCVDFTLNQRCTLPLLFPTGPEVYGEYNYGYDSYKAPNGYKDGYKPNSPEYDYNGYKTTTPPTHKDKYGYKAPATPGYER
jgi:hypothetical protein